MKFKSLITSFVFIVVTFNCFGQTENASQTNTKNYLGLEFSMMSIALKSNCLQNGNYVNGRTSYSNRFNVFTVEYLRKFKTINLLLLGSYLQTSREMNSSYTSFENKLIEYEYQGNFKHSQYFLMLIPSLNKLDQYFFYLKPGIGVNYNIIKQIGNSNIIINGLDDKFKRIRVLPNLNQSKLSIRLAIDFGMKSQFFNESLLLMAGIRLSTSTHIKMKKENIYTNSNLTQLYLSILLALK